MDWLGRIDSIIRIESIGKIEAARRQFCTAVRLFFSNGDSVSVHTLGWAAHEIFERTPESGVSLLHDIADEPDNRTGRREMAEAMRFFKHNQGAPFKTIKFIENLNEWLLLDCAMMHRNLTSLRLRESRAISVWMAMRFPNVVPLMLPIEVPGAIDHPKEAWGNNKERFLEWIDSES